MHMMSCQDRSTAAAHETIGLRAEQPMLRIAERADSERAAVPSGGMSSARSSARLDARGRAERPDPQR
jgi:hypothetical protein